VAFDVSIPETVLKEGIRESVLSGIEDSRVDASVGDDTTDVEFRNNFASKTHKKGRVSECRVVGFCIDVVFRTIDDRFNFIDEL
jgi:hypothetical protein